MDQFKLSISGIRGVVTRSFAECVYAFVRAFGCSIAESFREPVVGVARDSRASGKELQRESINILQSLGVDVLDLGLLPTPTVLFTVSQLQLSGGLMITASHNPAEWNGLKLINSFGVFLNEEELQKLHAMTQQQTHHTARKKGKVTQYPQAASQHCARAQELFLRRIQNAEHSIQDMALKVVVDPVNGAGTKSIPEFLRALGVEVVVIHGDTEKPFERKPEPTANNLQALAHAIGNHGANFGLALDPDADRLVCVSETGEILSEELTLALAIQSFLTHAHSHVAVNMSTSRLIDDIARGFAVKVFRTKVGEAHVLHAMNENNCLIGGEGNGGVILPELTRGRDPLSAIVLILSHMVVKKCSLGNLCKALSYYTLLKESCSYPQEKLPDLYDKVLKRYSGEVSELDGLRVDCDEFWFHIRPSNTEHCLRIFVESKTENQAQRILKELQALL